MVQAAVKFVGDEAKITCAGGWREEGVCCFFFPLSRKCTFSFLMLSLIGLWQYYIFLGKMEEGQSFPERWLSFSRGQL